jgi:hypothetical protein
MIRLLLSPAKTLDFALPPAGTSASAAAGWAVKASRSVLMSTSVHDVFTKAKNFLWDSGAFSCAAGLLFSTALSN